MENAIGFSKNGSTQATEMNVAGIFELESSGNMVKYFRIFLPSKEVICAWSILLKLQNIFNLNGRAGKERSNSMDVRIGNTVWFYLQTFSEV